MFDRKEEWKGGMGPFVVIWKCTRTDRLGLGWHKCMLCAAGHERRRTQPLAAARSRDRS
jgi:hypothetical protein